MSPATPLAPFTHSQGGGGSGTDGFALLTSVPQGYTAAATSVTYTSAHVDGAANPRFFLAAAFIEYDSVQGSIEGGGGGRASMVDGSGVGLLSGNSVLAVAGDLTSLAPGTTYYFRVCAQTPVGTGCGATLTFTTPQDGWPYFTAQSPPATSTCGSLYDYTMVATSDTQGDIFTYLVLSGALPDGLTLDPQTGDLSGTINTAGNFTFYVGATNSAGTTSSTLINVLVAALPSQTSSSSATNTGTSSSTSTGTPSSSSTGSPTPTNTGTHTLSSTHTRTPSSTQSGTPTSTSTGTHSLSSTHTRTHTPSHTTTGTVSSSMTQTTSPTGTGTQSPTTSGTPTSSSPPTSSMSATPLPSTSATPSVSQTRSVTTSSTGTQSASQTGSPSLFAPLTPTPTPSPAPRVVALGLGVAGGAPSLLVDDEGGVALLLRGDLAALAGVDPSRVTITYVQEQGLTNGSYSDSTGGGFQLNSTSAANNGTQSNSSIGGGSAFYTAPRSLRSSHPFTGRVLTSSPYDSAACMSVRQQQTNGSRASRLVVNIVIDVAGLPFGGNASDPAAAMAKSLNELLAGDAGSSAFASFSSVWANCTGTNSSQLLTVVVAPFIEYGPSSVGNADQSSAAPQLAAGALAAAIVVPTVVLLGCVLCCWCYVAGCCRRRRRISDSVTKGGVEFEQAGVAA